MDPIGQGARREGGPMSDKFWGDLALMAGFGYGLYWFFDGFRVYREYQVLANTPESRIRSLAMGLVEIRGRTSGDETLISPLSHTPCFLYKVEIERWDTDRGRGRWSHYWTDTRTVTFYVADATGKVLVDPRDAEYDLMRRAVREIGSSGGGWGLLTSRPSHATVGSAATDQELTEYVANLGNDLAPGDPSREDLVKLIGVSPGSSEVPLLGRPIFQQILRVAGSAARTDRFRLTEYYIAPGEFYDVTGTCIENSRFKDGSDCNLIHEGENEATFLISWRDARGTERALRKKAILRIFGGAALAITCLYLFIVLSEIGLI